MSVPKKYFRCELRRLDSELKMALKLTQRHLHFQKIFRGLHPGPLPFQGEGAGLGGDHMGNSRFTSIALHCPTVVY